MGDFIDNFAGEVLNSGLCSWLSMRGGWGFEIRDLEDHFKIQLPTLYKDFFIKMGKGAGRFMQGTDFFYKGLFGNREAMEEVLELDGHPFFLGKNIFVFSSHQGYIFHFFDTAEDIHDPPVYGYQEGHLKYDLIAEKFSTFLQTLLEEQKAGWNF
jgi:hypothetical protein